MTFLVATFMIALTAQAQLLYTMTSNPTSYCENTQITLKFYWTGSGAVTNASFGGSSSYRVYINSASPFTAGIALGSAYNPDSIGSASVHYLQKFSASNPGTITVTIPSGYVGSPKIGVTLISGTGGSPMGSNAPVPAITVYSATQSTPTVTIAGGQSICSGSSVTLTSSSAYLYSWNPGGQTTSSIVVSPTSTTTYSLTVSNACSNSASTTKTINVAVAPTAAITPNTNQSICQGSSVLLSASGGTTYSWSNGSTTSDITVSVAGSYYAVVSNGCPSQDAATSTVTVVVNSTPTVTVTPSSATICSGSSVTLSASGGNTYQWASGGQTTSSIVIAPTTNSVYSVTATSANGCTNTSSSSVSVNALPVANAGVDKTILVGNSATIGGASSGTSYSWSNGATTQTIVVSPTITSTYTLIVSGQCGSDTDSVTVVVTTTPTSVEDVTKDAVNISVYPNPTSNELSINLLEGFYNKEAVISVCDMVGNKIISAKSDTTITRLNVSELTSGTYFIVINCDGINYTRKFVKVN